MNSFIAFLAIDIHTVFDQLGVWGRWCNQSKKHPHAIILQSYRSESVFAINKLLSPFDGIEHVFGNHPGEFLISILG